MKAKKRKAITISLYKAKQIHDALFIAYQVLGGMLLGHKWRPPEKDVEPILDQVSKEMLYIGKVTEQLPKRRGK